MFCLVCAIAGWNVTANATGGVRAPGLRRPGTHPHFPAVCVYYDFNVKNDQYRSGK